MKKSKSLLILLLGLFVLFSGCEKKNIKPEYKNKLVGELHNKYLGEIMNNANKDNINIDYLFSDVVPDLLNSYYSENPDEKRMTPEEAESLFKPLIEDFAESQDMENFINNLPDNIELTNAERQAINDVKEIIFDQEFSVEEKNNLLQIKEANIEDDSSISDTKKVYLLSYTSTAISSMEFWENYTSSNPEKSNFWIIVGADALGALVGGSFGGWLGAAVFGVANSALTAGNLQK